MTSRERVINAIERQPIDRIPKNDSFWDTTIAEFQKQGMPALPAMPVINADGLQKPAGNPVGDFFGFDMDTMFMDVSMRLPTKVLEDDGERYIVQDRFGWTAQKYKGRSSSMHFLDHAVKTKQDWDKLKEGMILNPSDVSRLDSESYYIHLNPFPSWKGTKAIYDAFRKRNKYLMFSCYGPYECTWRHHGYENSLMDLLEEPEWMEEMLCRVTDTIISTLEYSMSLGMKPDGLFMAEDLGEMRSTLFSSSTYKSLLFPQHKRLADFLHKNSIHLLMHCCGKIDSFIPMFIEAGIDVLQALQANTGLDIVDLKQRFGKDMTFYGNIGVEAFARGKAAIKNEIYRKIPPAMDGYGYIYHSDHSIPPDIPFDTYRYCMELIDEIGVYK